MLRTNPNYLCIHKTIKQWVTIHSNNKDWILEDGDVFWELDKEELELNLYHQYLITESKYKEKNSLSQLDKSRLEDENEN